VAEVKTLVCDMCGESPAEGYALRKRPGAEFIIDLCSKCATPFRDWQAAGRAPAGKKRPYRKYGGKTPVLPA